ncbi:MAG: phosphoglucomutase, alpha-D-glucose phosphate-specific, partial [Actinomycetota bacterium]|nr:phosphoglucomutase, alpha-D-glucose phosphate-specific [Actinomycetota bacterium]
MTHERAGLPAQDSDLVDVAKLITLYYADQPDPDNIDQRVAFGTSGHRGTSLRTSFNEQHILATTQAIVEYRTMQGTDGPLFLAKDTHGLSEPAWVSALEVLAANDVAIRIDSRDGYTPTPALSHAILAYNRGRSGGLADGIVVTPSHNPPTDGGFKYNPPDGGPASSEATGWIQDRANALIAAGMAGVKRIPLGTALALDSTSTYDFLDAYSRDLPNVLNLDAVRDAGLKLGADPMGGAAV